MRSLVWRVPANNADKANKSFFLHRLTLTRSIPQDERGISHMRRLLLMLSLLLPDCYVEFKLFR